MASSSRWVFASSLHKVSCDIIGATQVVRFQQGAPRANIACSAPVSSPGSFSFIVHMKDKKVKTAIGFLSENQTTEYMRDTPIGEKFVSFGGAGWIHPKEIQASQKYAEGDFVKAEVNFDDQKVRFYVNDKFAGEDTWDCGKAYPAISADGGPCELPVTFQT